MVFFVKCNPISKEVLPMILPLSDVARMVEYRRSVPLYPFEPIEASFNYRLPSFEKKIDSIITKGYPMRPAYLFRLSEPLPWQHKDSTSYHFYTVHRKSSSFITVGGNSRASVPHPSQIR